MVAVSDLAAMGAWPRSALVSIAAPRGTDLERLGAGMADASVESRCVVVGGDLSESPAPGGLGGGDGRPEDGSRSGSTPAFGGPGGGSPVRHRSVGCPQPRGCDSCVGGDRPGGGASSDLIGAYLRPVARLREGEVARLSGASAAIDVSDGLISDLRHLGGSSRVGIDLEALPVAQGATEEEALGGGEEYELLVATPEPDDLVRGYRAAGLRPPLAVGRCTGRPGRYEWDGVALPEGGWRHRF